MPLDNNCQRVLVTGSAGYIGAIVCPLLMQHGYDVTGIDACWYQSAELIPSTRSVEQRRIDVRDLQRSDLDGFDAIVHLAALSNDPLGEIDPDLTYAINYHATMRLAELARQAGVKRFIFSGSCSIYGSGATRSDASVDETAPMDPKTPYAISKVRAERDLFHLNDDSFTVVSIRNATAFGISPSQRFDVVLPNLAGHAWVYNEVRLRSDGTPWRPIVHVRDIAQAIICCLQAQREQVAGQAFNVGSNDNNYQIRDIADAVHQHIGHNPPICLSRSASPDERTYIVNFDKITTTFPDYQARWSLNDGVHESRVVFSQIELSSEMFENPNFTRLNRIRELLNNGHLDADLRWQKMPTAAA